MIWSHTGKMMRIGCGRSSSCPLMTQSLGFLPRTSLATCAATQGRKSFTPEHSDGLLVPEARHIPAIKDLEDAALVFNRGIGSLIEKATHLTVALRGPVTVAHTRALVID